MPSKHTALSQTYETAGRLSALISVCWRIRLASSPLKIFFSVEAPRDLMQIVFFTMLIKSANPSVDGERCLIGAAIFTIIQGGIAAAYDASGSERWLGTLEYVETAGTARSIRLFAIGLVSCVWKILSVVASVVISATVLKIELYFSGGVAVVFGGSLVYVSSLALGFALTTIGREGGMATVIGNGVTYCIGVVGGSLVPGRGGFGTFLGSVTPGSRLIHFWELPEGSVHHFADAFAGELVLAVTLTLIACITLQLIPAERRLTS